MTQFHKLLVLDDAIDILANGGYRLHDISCYGSQDEQSILFGIVDSLRILRHPNIGLDGFNDFISQIDFTDTMGVVIALRAFDLVYQSFPDFAFHVLDIMADNHRSHLLRGNRLLTLVQSENPRIDEKLGKVGGYTPVWNPKEWMNKDRGLR